MNGDSNENRGRRLSRERISYREVRTGEREFRRFRSSSAASDVVATPNKMAMAAGDGRGEPAPLGPLRARADGGGQDAAAFLSGQEYLRRSGRKEEKGIVRRKHSLVLATLRCKLFSFDLEEIYNVARRGWPFLYCGNLFLPCLVLLNPLLR